jgi:hypothetical protein
LAATVQAMGFREACAVYDVGIAGLEYVPGCPLVLVYVCVFKLPRGATSVKIRSMQVESEIGSSTTTYVSV